MRAAEAHLYEQDTHWIDSQGRIHEIAYMELDHVANLLAYLRRNANRILSGYMLSGWQQCMQTEHETDAAMWLEETPLMGALRERMHDAADECIERSVVMAKRMHDAAGAGL